MKTYFYDNEVKLIKGEKKYIVYSINHNGNIDIAERKVKTITQKLKRKLAGGYFSDNSIPYNFKADYTVIDIPYNTPARAYDKKDKYIIDIIKRGVDMNKKINSNGTCQYCNTKNIEYGIKNGNYTYYCHKCKKYLGKREIKISA